MSLLLSALRSSRIRSTNRLIHPALIATLLPSRPPSHPLTMATTPASTSVHITALEKSDYAEWERLFRLYIAFYKSSLPDTQYPKTFSRILDQSKDLDALVLRDAQNPSKLYGLAHFFPVQTPWAEEMLLHLNGTF